MGGVTSGVTSGLSALAEGPGPGPWTTQPLKEAVLAQVGSPSSSTRFLRLRHITTGRDAVFNTDAVSAAAGK